MKKHSNSAKESELRAKRVKSRGPVQRETREVMAEIVGKLSKKMDAKALSASDGPRYS
jgi:hypothetical protein